MQALQWILETVASGSLAEEEELLSQARKRLHFPDSLAARQVLPVNSACKLSNPGFIF